jgi:L-ribulose-5-phosphate 3-epimerase
MAASHRRRSPPLRAVAAELPSRRLARRRFCLAGAAAVVARTTPAPAEESAAVAPPGGTRRLRVFSKHLQWLDAEPLAETAAAAGFGGIDLTVRPGGHVEPDRVTTDLPRFVAAARRQGLALDMLVTAITSADDPHADTILRTAADQGVRLYRPGYFPFEPRVPLAAGLDDLRRRAAALADLNRRCGIGGGYQNHHGTQLGGSLWDLQTVLDGIDPRWLGSQYDIRHAVSEATGSWEIGWRRIAPHVTSLALKDFRWDDGRPLRPVTVPSGEGLVPWERFAAAVVATPPPVPPASIPLTAHCEFFHLDGAEQTLDMAAKQRIAVEQLGREAVFLAEVVAAFQPGR